MVINYSIVTLVLLAYIFVNDLVQLKDLRQSHVYLVGCMTWSWCITLMPISVLFNRMNIWLILDHFIDRSKKWVVNTRRDDLWDFSPETLYKNYSLCSDHFELSQFMNPQKKKLIWNAIPTLFTVPNPPPAVTPKRSLPSKRKADHVGPKPKRTKGNVDAYLRQGVK